MTHPLFLGGYEDVVWCGDTTFGSGVAKALVRYISDSGGSDVCIELDYAYLSPRLEFSEADLRVAVAHLIANSFARVVHDYPRLDGDVLVLLTPGRLADDAQLAALRQEKAEARAAKIALRGGRVHRAPIPTEIRDAVFARDGHACLSCDNTDGLTLDHVKPWSLGGLDVIDNLQTLCRSCNSRKGARI